MKYTFIKAIIRINKLNDVREALNKIGVEYFTYYEASGITYQNEQKFKYRGRSITGAGSIPRKIIEVVIPSDDSSEVIETLKKAATTGVAGDGKIYFWEIDNVIRISL